MVFIKIKNNKPIIGFTLVEILVSIGIMAIIFAIAALNLNARKPQVMVENAAREFLSQLQFAKNLALTGAVFKDEDDPEDGQLDVPFGYGLHFLFTNQYIIFGDLYGPNPAGDKKYNDGEETDWGNSSTEDGFVVDMKIDVDITSIESSDVVYPLDIFFETFNGRINYYYNGMDQPDEVNELQIKFSYEDDPSVNQTVIVIKDTNQIYLQE